VRHDPFQHITDQELLERYYEGQKNEWLGILLQRYTLLLFGVCMKYMKDEEKAHDVTQDALLLAYRHRASFRGDSRFTTWLYRIAATTALMHLRKDRRVPQLQSIDAEDTDAANEPRNEDATPEEQWASSEAVQIAGDRLARLGDKYGQIFAMRFVEGA